MLARRDVDLVDLRRAPVVLQKEILTGGTLVADDSPEACERFAADAMAIYVAFRDELKVAGSHGGRR